MSVIKMILTNGFDPDVRVYKEAKYLLNKGHEVDILCWDRKNYYKDKQIENIDGINIRRYEILSKPGSGFKQLPAYFIFLKKCRKELRKGIYDYLHCHDLDGMIIGYFSNNKNAKLIFDMHELYISGRFEKFAFIIKRILKFLQNKSYKIIYLNDIQKNTMSSRNKEKLVFLPNYPELERFKGAEKTYSDKLRISFTGTVRQYESLKALIDATGGNDNIFVSINGDGTSYLKVKEASVNYSNVEVTGKFNYKDIVGFYNNSDLFYCAYNNNIINHNNAIATKFYEAIATLTPMIVTKGTEMDNICKKYNIGIGIDSQNSSEIKKVLNDLYYNRTKINNMAVNMQKMQFNFSWETVATNLENIY